MSKRNILIDWVLSGNLPPQHLHQAVELTAALPDGKQWQRFIQLTCLAVGLVSLISGIIFFFAYNWQQLSHLIKFALAQSLMLLTLATIAVKGLDTIIGQAANIVFAVLIGCLLALVGQHYQTGADSYQLFVIWAILMLPFALLGRNELLWLILLVILNLSLYLYLDTLFWYFDSLQLIWLLLFLVNLIGLVLREFYRPAVFHWLVGNLGAQLLAISCIALCSTQVMSVWHIFEAEGFNILLLPIWFVFVITSLCYFRFCRADRVILAFLTLTAVIVVSFLILNNSRVNLDTIFLVAVIDLAITGAGAYWIKLTVIDNKL